VDEGPIALRRMPCGRDQMTPNELIMRLEAELSALPREHCCELIGELERLKARVWCRLLYSGSAPPELIICVPLLTVDQIAERLQVARARVYELIRQGKLPVVRIGKHIRMEATRLEAWIAQHGDDALDTAASTARNSRMIQGR